MDSFVAQPRISALESDIFLKTIMIEAGNQMTEYKETEIASNVPCDLSTGKYMKFPPGVMYGVKGSGARDKMGNSESISFPPQTAHFALQERAFNVPMNNFQIQEYGGPQSWEIIQTRALYRTLLDLRAYTVTQLLNPTNLAALGASVITMVDATTDLTKTRLDIPGSDPFKVFGQMVKNVRAGCGRWPNVIAIPFVIAQALLGNAAFVERYKYFAPTTESVELPGQMRGMKPKVMATMTTSTVPNKNDTTKGDTPTLVDMWGNNMFAMYIDPQSTVQSMTALARFFYSPEPFGTVSWAWNNTRGRTVESWLYEEWQIPAPGAICCAKGVLSVY